jgi:hypothetical protein
MAAQKLGLSIEIDTYGRIDPETGSIERGFHRGWKAAIAHYQAKSEPVLEITGRSDYPGYVIAAEINGYAATLRDKLYASPQPSVQVQEELERLRNENAELNQWCRQYGSVMAKYTGNPCTCMADGKQHAEYCPVWTLTSPGSSISNETIVAAAQVPGGFKIEKNEHEEFRVEILAGTERGHASAWLTPHEEFEGRMLYWLSHDLLTAAPSIAEKRE